MENASEFVPSTTYFDEREQRLLKEIAEAQTEIDAAKKKFAGTLADLTRRRDIILEQTIQLRESREGLESRSKDGREQIQQLSSLVLQCETLTAELNEFLKPSDVQIADIDREVASLEEQERKKTAKPAKAVEKLQGRLARLKLRRALAEKQGAQMTAEDDEEPQSDEIG